MAFLVETLEALRTRVIELEARIPEQDALRARCEELEARVNYLEGELESQEMHAAADNFDLAALEELMSTDWMMQGGGSGSGDGLPNLSRVAACPTLRLRGSSTNRRLELSRPFALLARPQVSD